MPETELIPIEDFPETTPKETAKEKFEQERRSRRQALKKLGITSAMATFAMFSVEDLAHMVGKAMQQRARDNKVVEQIAREFQEAGVAFAGGPSWAGCGDCTDYCVPQKYFKCTPCIFPFTGQTPTAKDLWSNYTMGTNKNDCYACCETQSPLKVTTQSYLWRGIFVGRPVNALWFSIGPEN